MFLCSCRQNKEILAQTGAYWYCVLLVDLLWSWFRLVLFAIYVTTFVQTWQRKKKQFRPDDPCSVCARYGDVQSCSTKLGHFRSMTSGLFRVHTAECGRDVKRCWEIGHPSTSPVCQSSENRWIALTVPTMCLSQFECVWFNALEGSVRDGGSAFGFIFALLYL